MFEKVLTFYTRYFTIWVVLCGILAYVLPGPFVAVKGGMTWFFALTMFGIGVVLEPADFKRITEQPWIVLIGCCAQFTIMPLGAFAVATIFHLPAPIAVGLILAGSAPGAMASNVMSYIAKADTAFFVFICIITASILSAFWQRQDKNSIRSTALAEPDISSQGN